ncbi:MAG: DUF3313 family protein [Pseudomonadota bacterium]
MRGLKQSMRLLATGLVVTAAAAALALPMVAIAKEKPPQEWDGLERQSSKKMDNVYVRPNVQFTAYKKVKLDPVEVKMDKDWDPNSGTRGVSGRITSEDIEKIRTDAAALFQDEFVKRLTRAGYPVVTTSGDDVLQLKAAVINVYINAPEKMTAGISRSYTMDAGRATVVMDASDSVTGQSLARVVDTQQGLDNGRLQWTTSVSNSAEARRIVGLWADAVVRALDRVNGKAK